VTNNDKIVPEPLSRLINSEQVCRSCRNFGYLVTYFFTSHKAVTTLQYIYAYSGSTYGCTLMRLHNSMKPSQVRTPAVRIAVIDSDPVRFVGFRALLSTESDFELQSVALAEIGTNQKVDVVLLGSHPGKSVIDVLTTVKALRPGLDVIVTGCNLDDAAILNALSAGAKGCVDETASVGELVRAIRTVLMGSVWAPRRVLSMFVDQTYRSSDQRVIANRRPFTSREKEVLGMLVAGCSNKEIAAPLGIEERTVKAHVAKLLRKVGVSNRVMLSVHAITHALVTSSAD